MRDGIEFEDGVKAHIQLFDDLLAGIGAAPIFENHDFSFNNESSNAYAAIFDVVSQTNPNAAVMWLHLMGDGIRLDIDGINELYEWSDKHIKDSRDDVVPFLGQVLTGFILIETHGSGRFVEIFDSSGNFVTWISRNNTIHMITGLRISRYKSYRRMFLPFYRV